MHLSANRIASTWFMSESIEFETVASVISLIGAISATNLVASIYKGGLIGLQSQFTLNWIEVVVSTFKLIAAGCVLYSSEAPLIPYFSIHLASSLLLLLAFRHNLRIQLPPKSARNGFSFHELRTISDFGMGVLSITILGTVLSQLDKVIMSRYLSMLEWGCYSVAATVAGFLPLAFNPIYQALIPRLTQNIADGDGLERDSFHLGSQLTTVVVGSIAITAFVQPQNMLGLWLSDFVQINASAVILRWLVIGGLLNVLVGLATGLQLAAGWTSLGVKTNIIAVAIVVPLLLIIVPSYGAIGAAIVWTCLNAGYFLISVPVMFRTLVSSEKWAWYLSDLLLPISVGLGVGIATTYIPIHSGSIFTRAFLVVASMLSTMIAMALVCESLRKTISSQLSSIGSKAKIHG